MTFNHCTLSCLFFLTCTEHILEFNWTQRWPEPGSVPGGYPTAKEQGLYPRLLPSFFYSTTRLAHVVLHWPKSDRDIWTGRATTTVGLLSQTFYQLYMCYRDNSIVIRSSPSIISEVGSRKSEVGRPFSEQDCMIVWSVKVIFDSGAIKGGHTISVKLNCNQGHYFQFCVGFEFFFLVWVWDIRESEKKRNRGSIGGAFGFVESVSWRKMPLL